MFKIILSSSPPPSQSSDFFNSPIWQFLSGIGALIAIPIAIVGVIIAILAYRQQRRRKEITYQIVSDAPIANINKAVENRVKILLDNVEVKDTRLLVLTVWNSGNTSLEASDYFDPIIFNFNDSIVISSDMLETKPPDLINSNNLKTFLKLSTNSVELPTYPLNSKDSMSFTILLAQKSDITVSGRLKDGKIVEYHPSRNRSFFIDFLLISFLNFIAIAALLIIIISIANFIIHLNIIK